MVNIQFTTKQITQVLAVSVMLFGGSRLYRGHYYSSDNPKNSVEQIAAPQNNSSTAVQEPKIENGETTLVLGYGASVANLLTSFGADKQAATAIATSLHSCVAASGMKAGQTFHVKYTKTDGKISIDSLKMQSSIDKVIAVNKTNDCYECKTTAIKLTPTVHVFEGKIGSSFYSAALKSGASSELVKESVELLSYVVNFQHGIKSGATFKILTDALRNPEGKIVKVNGVKFIELNTGGQSYRLFAFDDGKCRRFYNEKGETVARSLLQTPVQMSKPHISSGFGTRMHPCLGYTREHKGVDFAAPTGTPVIAAGDGKVVSAGWGGSGYGNLVHILHSNGYETKYAHLKYINKNIRPGARVTQKQPLGGVGMTGLATGPHLHFEVIHNKRHINPMKVQSIPTMQLTGGLLKKFELQKHTLLQESSKPSVSI